MNKILPFLMYSIVMFWGRAGYELIYITNEAVGQAGYYQLISCKSEKNNCFSKFSSNSLDFFGWNLLKKCHFFLPTTPRKFFFPTSKITAQEIRHQCFLISWNLTIIAHIMVLGNQSEIWKIIILTRLAKVLFCDDRVSLLFLILDTIDNNHATIILLQIYWFQNKEKNISFFTVWDTSG